MACLNSLLGNCLVKCKSLSHNTAGSLHQCNTLMTAHFCANIFRQAPLLSRSLNSVQGCNFTICLVSSTNRQLGLATFLHQKKTTMDLLIQLHSHHFKHKIWQKRCNRGRPNFYQLLFLCTQIRTPFSPVCLLPENGFKVCIVITLTDTNFWF